MSDFISIIMLLCGFGIAFIASETWKWHEINKKQKSCKHARLKFVSEEQHYDGEFNKIVDQTYKCCECGKEVYRDKGKL